MVQKMPSMPIANEWLKPRQALGGLTLMDQLFNRFDGLYPTRWRSGFSNEKSIENWRAAWSNGLEEDGISPDEVKRGLAACQRRFDWPPSFAEFLSVCRSPVDPEISFNEAVMQMRCREEGTDQWSHPAIFWVAATVGAFDLRNASWPQIKARWTRLLQAELAKGEWPEIPPRRLCLPSPGETIPDAGKVKALADGFIRKSRDAVSTSQAKETWLRIKARFEAGEDVGIRARDLAEQALGERFIRRGKGVRPDVSDRVAGDKSFDKEDGGMVVL